MINQTIYARWVRYGVISGIFLIPFIPFLVSSSLFFPFITTKNFTFRILVEILLALWFILVLFDRSYLPKFSWLLVSVAAFVGIMAVADLAGENPYKSIWSNFERMEGLVTLVHLLAYTVVLASVIKAEKLWTYLFHTSIGASLIMGIYGVVQITGGAPIHQGSTRIDASLGNATYLAVYMLIHMFLTAFYLVRLIEREGDQIGKLPSFYPKITFYLSAIAFQFFILYHTATRGAFIGLFVGVFIAAIIVALFEKKKTILKKCALGAIVAVIVIVGGFFALKNTSFVKDSPVLARFSSISLSETTTKSRFLIWNMAFQGAKERPLLGWGQENFNYVFNKYYSPQMYNQEQWFDRTHNVVLDWLIAGGLLGLGGYLSIFGLLFYSFWFVRREKGGTGGLGESAGYFSLAEKAVLSGLLVAYFVHNLFVFDNLISYILFFTLIAYVAERTGLPKALAPVAKDKNQSADRSVAPLAFIPIIVIATSFILYVVNVPAIKTNTQLITALQPKAGVGPEKNLEMMKEVIGYKSFGTTEAREQLVQLTLQVVSSQGIPNDLKQKFAEYTSLQLKEQIAATPNDTRYLLFYGMYLSQLGSPDGMQYLAKALEKSPQKQTIIFEIVSGYLRAQKYPEALIEAKKAYDLAPEYTEALKIYALTAVYANKPELTDKLIAELPPGDHTLDDRFLQAYVAVKQYDRVLAILKDKISKDPNNFQTRIAVAQTYLELGYKDQAIKEIQIAITLNPQIKAQADVLIEQIRSGTLTR